MGRVWSCSWLCQMIVLLFWKDCWGGDHNPWKDYSDMIATLHKIWKYFQKGIVTTLNGMYSSSIWETLAKEALNQQLVYHCSKVKVLSFFTQQRFLDMTFGAGGHTTALLEKASDITIYALDRDPTAYKIAQQLSEAYP